MTRLKDLDQFYELLGRLRQRVGGERFLRSCHGKMDWPEQGVYLFFEEGEMRAHSNELRVVRVGTHAVALGSHTSLWERLRQHRGTTTGSHPGGGNHRGSIFRLHVGSALLERGDYPNEIRQTWGKKRAPFEDTRDIEYPLERGVSEYIGRMPFLWVRAEDEAGTDSIRSLIERNAIGLLSNANKPPLDPPSPTWLGHHCRHEAVCESGLWNVDHVYDAYDPGFLREFEHLVDAM